MTLDKAIETLKKMYEAALKMPFVFDPLAWALCGTWKLYLALPDSTISTFQVQDAPDANAGDTVSKKAVELALLEKGQSSERYKVGDNWELNFGEIREALATVPPTEPEVRPINYRDCSNAMLRMWMDNVVTDGEYSRIMDKLNAHWRGKEG